MTPSVHRHRTAASPPMTAWLALVALLIGAASAPPDLRLEWWMDGRFIRECPPLVGTAGSTATLRYRLRNVGGSEAFAAVLKAYTALGRQGRTVRLRPGPAAGRAFDRTLDLPLAIGMREVCIEARLQTISDDEPRDPHPDDNRLCRRVTVREAPGAASRGAGVHPPRGEKP